MNCRRPLPPLTRAQQALVARHTGLAYKIAKHYAGYWPHLDRDDLLQEAKLGICRAVLTWDRARGAFSTYAWRWMRAYLVDERERNNPISGTRIDYHPKRDIALKTKPLIRTSADRQKRKRARLRPVRLDGTIPGTDIPRVEAFVSPVASPHEIHEAKRRLEDLQGLLSTLDPRSREILVRRSHEETLQAIGEDLGLSRERIRQIEGEAMRRLRGCAWVRKAKEAV